MTIPASVFLPRVILGLLLSEVVVVTTAAASEDGIAATADEGGLEGDWTGLDEMETSERGDVGLEAVVVVGVVLEAALASIASKI